MLNETLDQQAIHNNLEIFERIVKELQEAKQEILVASAWFTDGELLELLTQKAKAGVKVEVIIADNKDNQKLDFQHLVNAGAKVYKIKSTGYGIMHQKFCVTDKTVVLHGSYNWTINAKKNNHESIIATNHKSTVVSFITNFENIKQKTVEMSPAPVNPLNKAKDFFSNLFNKNKSKEGTVSSKAEEAPTPQVVEVVDKRTEYEKVLDSMIAAEVSNFDRDLLRQQGYERSKANNGDHQVIGKGLDSLYSVFINDINVVEDKKARLITKIEEQKTKSIAALREGVELRIQTIEEEAEITKENLSNKKTALQSQNSIYETEIENIKKNKIPSIETKIKAGQEKIKDAQREFVKPSFRWFEFCTLSFLAVGLFSFLAMFYSSAAYILFFSIQDAKLAEANNDQVNLIEAFDPNAIAKAIEKGPGALFFIFLFVSLPILFSLAGRITDRWKSLLAMIAVDIIIATKISQSVHNVNYMAGEVDGKWTLSHIPTDINFWLVLIVGAGGLFFFSLLYNKIVNFLDERNPDVFENKSRLEIKQLQEEAQLYNNEILASKEEIEILEKNIIQGKSEIIICEAELENLPTKKLNSIEKEKSAFTLKSQNIGIITDIYKSHIENDNLPISVDSMKDRINIFLEGWNDFLHAEYAIAKAVEKSRLAAQTASEWQENKLNTNSVDRRVRF